MSSWTVTIFGACTRHAYKPLFENLPAWRLRGGKFRVFSAFFGENHWNRAPIAVKLRRERKPPRRRRFTEFRRGPRRRTLRRRVAGRVAASSAPAPRCWRTVRGSPGGGDAGTRPGCATRDAPTAGRGTSSARAVPWHRAVLADRDPGPGWGSSGRGMAAVIAGRGLRAGTQS